MEMALVVQPLPVEVIAEGAHSVGGGGLYRAVGGVFLVLGGVIAVVVTIESLCT